MTEDEMERLHEMIASRDNLARAQEMEIERLRAGIRETLEYLEDDWERVGSVKRMLRDLLNGETK